MTDTSPRGEQFASRVEGTDASLDPAGLEQTKSNEDPFAGQRTTDNNPFTEKRDSAGDLASSPPGDSLGVPQRDRRMSKEWDASKVPPSRFQKREGSLYATPNSRDAHLDKNKKQAFLDKLKEKGWN